MARATASPPRGPAAVSLPAPGDAMRPEALSRLKACRLSFVQSLLSRMIRERWKIDAARWSLDEQGRGLAIYGVDTGTMELSMVIFSDKLREEEQEERIVASRWDVMACLLEGMVSEAAVDRLNAELPRVIDGRMEQNALMWCRANRSCRVFEHTVDRLAAGRQPDLRRVAEAGYLMRTLDFRANGLNGSRPLLALPRDHPLRGPFFAQMLGSYIVRQFSLDLAEHIAARRAPAATRLDRAIARYLGVGNSSGIGLVLFALSHPHLIDRWLSLRFRAVAEALGARAREDLADPRMQSILERRIRYAQEDRTDCGGAFTDSRRIAADLELFRDAASVQPPSGTWAEVVRSVRDTADPESIEALHAVLLEAHHEHADRLARELVVEWVPADPPPSIPVRAIREHLERHFGWALELSLTDPDERHYFWYKSQENEEPRMGVRGREVGDDLTVDVVGDAHAVASILAREPADRPIAAVLRLHPEIRPMVRRIWTARRLRYHTPRINSTSRTFSPVHAMRFVLSGLYGLEKLYPMSGRWVRSVMMQGAPTADEVARGADEHWAYPPLPGTALDTSAGYCA